MNLNILVYTDLLKNKVFPCCSVEDVVTGFHYPVFMLKKLFLPPHPPFNFAWGTSSPPEQCWRLTGMHRYYVR